MGHPVIEVLGEGHLANVWIFFHHAIDKVVCPHLAAILGMPIWHPTNIGEVDALLAAQVDVYLLQLRLSSAVTQSFDNKFLSYM